MPGLIQALVSPDILIRDEASTLVYFSDDQVSIMTS